MFSFESIKQNTSIVQFNYLNSSIKFHEWSWLYIDTIIVHDNCYPIQIILVERLPLKVIVYISFSFTIRFNN